MTAILTAAEMRALEQAAIASGEVTGLELMERAGRGVVEAILAEWPEIAGRIRRAVVLCGPGNNGGDGFVVARLLRERGWEVTVLAIAEPDKMPPDAATAARRWRVNYGPSLPLTRASFNQQSRDADVIVDALFGIGLTRAIEGEVGDVIRDINEPTFKDWPYFRERVVCVDVPSGLNADTGWIPGYFDRPARRLGEPVPDPSLCGAPFARLTVTFDSPKPGHFLAHGPTLCGRLHVVDIGLGGRRISPWRNGRSVRHWSTTLVEQNLRTYRTDEVDYRYRHVLSKSTGHKYSHGHALLLSGGPGRGGAARLAARGALRIGAGLVTLAVPPAALQENAARLDVIMLRPVRDAEALKALLSDPRLNALCVGPGFGTGDREAALLAALLDASRGGPRDPAPVVGADAPIPSPAGRVGEGTDQSVPLAPAGPSASRPDTEADSPAAPSADPQDDPAPAPSPQAASAPADAKPRPVVLDADALTLLASHPELRTKVHPACVLTPHEGEFARLFPEIDAKWRAPATTGPAYSKVDAARDAARESGGVVLLKGPDTVIAEPPAKPGTPGRAAINAAVYDRAAPWLATAGSGDVLAGMITGLLARGFAPFDAACTAAWLHVEATRSFGPGLIAEDLPEELPKVFRALGL